jgi:hypothetical protein
VRFITLFVLLLFCKIFHWLSQDRIDFMDQGEPPTRLFHLRMVCVMSLMAIMDISMLLYSVDVSILISLIPRSVYHSKRTYNANYIWFRSM